MKLKYKKVILFTLVSTMGIGIVTLSIAPNKNKTQESINAVNVSQENSADVSPTEEIAQTITVTPALTVTAVPTIAPTPTPLPVYDLESEGYPKITKLIKNYYKAKLACDVASLKKLLSDPSNVATKNQLKKDIQYIEEYKNIKCYVKKGYIEGTYIVYVYNEVKFYNIQTPAPAADQFYIITDTDGNLKIFSGEFDELTEEYYNSRTSDSDVQALIKETNKKAASAKKTDKDLKAFWDKLDENQSTN